MATANTAANRGNADNSLLMEFFVDSLKDIYWAEKHLVKALPKMQEKATTLELVNAFAGHLEQTEGHVTRLEEVFDLIGEKASTKKCEAMAGIIAEPIIKPANPAAILVFICAFPVFTARRLSRHIWPQIL